ncbi:transferase family-domain-containing protein [Alternaria rosae]|uniref:transferase family-domain-containing protein n=1 Tax=Alternaria rosae TaxID=1187941 RepID=UPI001E8DCB6F|nr:transferase family-domain-containing protein [Alternaria rosae]KAH6851444.1 transferase family-domain-containing protein [Alternaria rosae]
MALPNLDMDIDLMGAQPALFKLYTQLAFFFPLSEAVAASQHQVTAIITAGLAELAKNFPWAAGQVVNANSDPKAAPLYKIRPYEPVPQLIVRDYTSDSEIPSLSQITDAGFPMQMLGEHVWAPCPTLAALGFDPRKASGKDDRPAPVMLVQISYIRGGMVLCVNLQHNVCDMMGQAAVIGWLSKACRGEQFTEEELKVGNMARRGVVSLIEDECWSPGTELQNQLFPPAPTVGKEPDTAESKITEAPVKSSWMYFDFSASSLKSLKDLATTTLPQDFTSFISTDDALSALIFLSVLRARQPRLPPSTPTTLARAVDARRYLNVHSNYPGILQNMAYTSYNLSTLLSTPLGHIAATMRQSVDPETSDVAWRTRSLITFLAQSPDNATKTSPTATLDMGIDIALSSWTKVPAYEWDFGLGLGKAVAVRRPGLVPVEGLVYLMPKSPDESVAVAMCLREEDLECLERDLEWQRFAKYVG